MDQAGMVRLVSDQRAEAEELLKRRDVIERDVPRERLGKYLSAPNILAILGVRRSGKSVISHLLLKGRNYGYLNFDDERLRGAGANDLNKLLEAIYEVYGKPECLLLDEVHNVKGWELFANRMRRSYRVVVTGSNAKMLSGELATHLTGRYADFTLYPFSFREYVTFKGLADLESGTTLSDASAKKALADYIDIGGLPEAYTFGKEMARKVYGDIINKDILRRFDIRNKSTFEELARYLVWNSGKEFTYSKLMKIFSLKRVETARRYVSYLMDSYLTIVLCRYSRKLKVQVIAPRKAYCIDTGIVRRVGLSSSEDHGHMYENIVAVELQRRKSLSEGTGDIEIFYWKDHKEREVDFVVKEGTRVSQLIQVAYELDPNVRRREIDGLLRAAADVKCKDLLLLTRDYEGTEKVTMNGLAGKVRFMPLWKWLLTRTNG